MSGETVELGDRDSGFPVAGGEKCLLRGRARTRESLDTPLFERRAFGVWALRANRSPAARQKTARSERWRCVHVHHARASLLTRRPMDDQTAEQATAHRATPPPAG